MSLAQRLTAPLRTRAGEPRGTRSLLADGGFWSQWSKAGKQVTMENVAGLSAVWAAVWLIADQGGSLPLRVYRKSGDLLTPSPGSWQWARLDQPNPESSAVDFWSVVIAHMDLWGNAYIGKQKKLGQVVALWVIPPEHVQPRRVKGRKVFDVTEDDGSVRTYTTDDIIHVRHRSLDGRIGASPLAVHRDTFGTALALDDFGGTLFKNRAVPLGVLSVKGRITQTETRDRLREEWDDRMKGKFNRIAILDEDAHFEPVTMPLADAQYVEQRKLSVQDIARIFGVPAELIGGESGSSMTYSNLSARNSDLLQFTLWSRLGRIQGAMALDRDLFPVAGPRLVPKFDDGDLVRGNPREQYEALRIAAGNKPILTQDEARQKLGYAPLGGTAAELSPAPSGPDPKDQQDTTTQDGGPAA